MSILVLGSHSYQLIPDVNGDPLTVSPSGNVPAVSSGTGTPTGIPPYGTGTLYVDTTNFLLYIYQNATWNYVGTVVPTGLVRVLDKTTTDAIITGAGPVNTLSYTIPGGTLGTSGVIRTKLAGRWVNAAGANRQVTVTVSYGGTTMWSDTSTNLGNGSDVGWVMELVLAANNSVTSQKLTGKTHIGGLGTTSIGLSGDLLTDEILANTIMVGNNSAVNSAVDQAFNVSISFNNTGTTWTKYYHTIELL